jgi:hypothetical protein
VPRPVVAVLQNRERAGIVGDRARSAKAGEDGPAGFLDAGAYSEFAFSLARNRTCGVGLDYSA